jgi:chromosome segregation protein
VEIEAGMTGIVGPNGCGKSNVVEGLRWVMGESNARQMRGGEMDDLIFAGTDQRPARNLAEIKLRLDNSKRTAPAEFNNDDEIEIIRKIERGKGSGYAVNGRPARAKDVQLLFADSATGARSSGMVSQGRIGAIVGAKPVDRRALLEEAANITGLHSRRHEAELRLRGAETNLERLDDVIAGLIEQRESLRKQARQASRYRSVADRIRKAEAQLLLSKWTTAEAGLASCEADLRTIRLAVAAKTEAAAKSATLRTELAAALPPLREAETAKAAEYQRLLIGREELGREEERVREALERLRAQQDQISKDMSREMALRDDATSANDSLGSEITELQARINNATPQRDAANRELDIAREGARIADSALAEASAQLRAAAATRTSLANRIADLQTRKGAAESARATLDIAQMTSEAESAQTAHEEAEAACGLRRTALDAAEHALGDAQGMAEIAVSAQRDALSHLTRLQAEIDALQFLLADTGNPDEVPVGDLLTVRDGMEDALAAYLAEELNAPIKSGASSYWRGGSGGDLRPAEGSQPLADFIDGAPDLAATLAGVGIVEDAATAETMQASLTPGQALTTISGGLWRWDGFVRKTGAGDKSAERIRQRQRLDNLQKDAVSASRDGDSRQQARNDCEKNLAACRETLSQARAYATAGEQDLATARRRAESDALKLQAAQDRVADLQTTLDTVSSELLSCEAEAKAMGDDAALAKAEAAARTGAEAAREGLSEAMQAVSQLNEVVRAATQRMSECERERKAWLDRLDGAAARVTEMQNRLADGKTEEDRLHALPGEIERQRHEMADRLETASTARQDAGDALQQAETALASAEADQREQDSALASVRETLIRGEGQQERLGETLTGLRASITEKLSCAPQDIGTIADVSDATTLPDIETLDDRLQRLIRERDNIGPVNLRAEAEMEEVSQRITSMEEERDDLLAAIAKLRAAISQLNREGRERLLRSFAEVNGHFKTLFKQLFGGGNAELQLTEADDPLEAGLEIMASPPGKRLQSLSLLSGGEQALTALAIIFAVFLTNPAPICVLDEVDAPLDDSNVVRFCDLLRDICSKTDTRFLVVTHHRMTMARMDRLFGVTMEQRGISKLVSVDLQTAEQIRDAAVA